MMDEARPLSALELVEASNAGAYLARVLDTEEWRVHDALIETVERLLATIRARDEEIAILRTAPAVAAVPTSGIPPSATAAAPVP